MSPCTGYHKRSHSRGIAIFSNYLHYYVPRLHFVHSPAYGFPLWLANTELRNFCPITHNILFSFVVWTFAKDYLIDHCAWDLTGPPFYCRRRTRFNLCILLLLIIGGVEVNPGPSSSLNLTFGMLHTRSVVNKAPLLHTQSPQPNCRSRPVPPGTNWNVDQKWPCTARLTSESQHYPHILWIPTSKIWPEIPRYRSRKHIPPSFI